MSGTWLLCCSLALLLASCSLSREPGRGGGKTKQVIHPNGLSVTVPETLFVEEIPQGFIVSPPGPKDFRVPQEVTVLFDRWGSPPQTRWIDTCSVNGHKIYYRIDDDSRSSAEQQYTFRAWMPIGRGGWLMLRQVDYGPWPTVPGFDLAWTVIAGMEVPGDDR